ncbi:MAG TPA: exopolysaccharide biosynthesis polyprenyl glycosylphosphotransferase, partial [Bacteroidales bacterium]
SLVWIITASKQRKVRNGQLSFDTIIVGCQQQAKNIFDELTLKKAIYGNRFIGYIQTSDNNSKFNELPCLGTIQDFPDIIKEYSPSEIIIATESSESEKTKEILNWLGYSEITVKIVAEISSHLKGQLKISNILGTALFEIDHQLMPLWQQALKACIDFTGAVLAILLFLPLIIIIAIGVKVTSKGPIFFRQERIGKNGKPFVLYKFRSMYVDAEKNGPNLSTQNDRRCTPFGRLLRQTKLDEIPNFYNVLKGDMSLVGPRPERKYYIEQIVKIAPNYKQLQKIKPGITSLGQVRYGYASNIEQMVKRLRYDLIYLENMSLRTDFLVIYYTIVIIFKGRHI